MNIDHARKCLKILQETRSEIVLASIRRSADALVLMAQQPQYANAIVDVEMKAANETEAVIHQLDMRIATLVLFIDMLDI